MLAYKLGRPDIQARIVSTNISTFTRKIDIVAASHLFWGAVALRVRVHDFPD
jgi:hypothetical protein